MIDNLNWTATARLHLLFRLVTVMGFMASRWKAGDLGRLHEWGLGGRRFGAWITWFLLGGDLYTAYTVIAMPALVYAIGAYGFFAVPYTIVIYPFLFLDDAAAMGGVASARLHHRRRLRPTAATATNGSSSPWR